MSELLDATGAGDDEQRAGAVARAVELLLAGELVVLPSDAVYGVAADAFSAEATEALRVAKDRDRAIPLPVMIRSANQLAGLAATVPSAADHLVAAFWPGPLTLVLHAQPRLTWDIGEAEGTVAIRMPREEATLEVIRAVGPLAVTTANAPGGDPPRSVEEAQDQLGDRIAAYLDAGACPPSGLSTIVDLTRASPRVLREGAIPAELALDVAEGRVDPGSAGARLAGEVADDGPDGEQ